jgi:3'-phosphoadenosine 5'-phosphosulfate synthase
MRVHIYWHVLFGNVCRYNDGLDKWRLSTTELMAVLAAKKADAVYAFQTRNPTHAGHAYLMKTSRDIVLKQGFKNPILLLSPLGG